MPKTLPAETDEKECPRCEKVKPVKEFGFRECKVYVKDEDGSYHADYKTYTQSQCKPCRNAKPFIQTKKEAAKEEKQRRESESIAQRILNTPACKMIGHCCITMLGGIGDGLGCMYYKKPMEKSEHPADQLAKPTAEDIKNWEKNAANLPKPKTKKDAFKYIWITGDKGTLRILYQEHFPNDTNNNKRAAKFMIQKLMKRLGDKAKLTPTAKKILEG